MSTLAQRRAAVLEEYARAAANPSYFNRWPELAAELAALIPTGKASALTDRSAWDDYQPVSWKHADYERGEFRVSFHDGESFRVTSPCRKSRPYNWGRAYRVACAFWRLRVSARMVREAGHGRDPERRARIECTLSPPRLATIECNGTAASVPSRMLE